MAKANQSQKHDYNPGGYIYPPGSQNVAGLGVGPGSTGSYVPSRDQIYYSYANQVAQRGGVDEHVIGISGYKAYDQQLAQHGLTRGQNDQINVDSEFARANDALANIPPPFTQPPASSTNVGNKGFGPGSTSLQTPSYGQLEVANWNNERGLDASGGPIAGYAVAQAAKAAAANSNKANQIAIGNMNTMAYDSPGHNPQSVYPYGPLSRTVGRQPRAAQALGDSTNPPKPPAGQVSLDPNLAGTPFAQYPQITNDVAIANQNYVARAPDQNPQSVFAYGPTPGYIPPGREGYISEGVAKPIPYQPTSALVDAQVTATYVPATQAAGPMSSSPASPAPTVASDYNPLSAAAPDQSVHGGHGIGAVL